MNTETSSFDKLIKEFSNIDVEIEISPKSFDIADSVEEIGFGQVQENIKDIEFTEYYVFFVKFQSEKKISFTNNTDFYLSYLKRIDELRISFYQDINNEIKNLISKFHILNLLSEYKIRFVETLDNYFDHEVNLPGGLLKLKGNRCIKYHYTQKKPILDQHRDRILDKYLSIQVESIKKIVVFLNEKIDLIKLLTIEEKQSSIPNSEKKIAAKRTFETKSFELNPELFKTDSIAAEKLKEFKEALYKAGYIKQIDFRFFLKVFTNQEVQKPIIWIGDPKELYYLIKQLYDKGIIIKFKNFWEVTCYCILAYDKASNVCTPHFLQRCKAPTRGDKLRKLNSVIDTLK